LRHRRRTARRRPHSALEDDVTFKADARRANRVGGRAQSDGVRVGVVARRVHERQRKVDVGSDRRRRSRFDEHAALDNVRSRGVTHEVPALGIHESRQAETESDHAKFESRLDVGRLLQRASSVDFALAPAPALAPRKHNKGTRCRATTMKEPRRPIESNPLYSSQPCEKKIPPMFTQGLSQQSREGSRGRLQCTAGRSESSPRTHPSGTS